jgi:hypothetical protein
MNETSRVLEESHPTAASPEKEPKAAEYDVRVAADAPAHASRALPSRRVRPNFMDFFAPRRRQPTDPSVRDIRRSPSRLPSYPGLKAR